MTSPCCYSDANGTACKCRMRADAEADRDRIAREWADVSQSNYQRAKAAEAEAERNAAIAVAAMTRISEARDAWLAFKDAWDLYDWSPSAKRLDAALNAAHACVSEQNHSPDAGNMVDATTLRGIAERDANG